MGPESLEPSASWEAPASLTCPAVPAAAAALTFLDQCLLAGAGLKIIAKKEAPGTCSCSARVAC